MYTFVMNPYSADTREGSESVCLTELSLYLYNINVNLQVDIYVYSKSYIV